MESDDGVSDLEADARGRIGTTLRGKYRLDKVIGLGGMAVVYKATHRNQAEFAVKMLHPELSLRVDVRTRFLREGYAANSVKHPGVVLVVDDDVAEDGAAFIVMELLDGVGCDTLWEDHGGRIPLAAACCITQQLLDVLTSVHAKGIIHRDLKPANLFVTRDGRVKVLDFGIARVRDVAVKNATQTGMLLGTPAFMAPEQALGNTSEIDAQTDIWAAGASLFTMLSGALVHEADNAQQILIKAATQKARSLSEVVPGMAKEVVAVVDRSLAFDKADRWPDARTMREALEQACEAATGFRPGMSTLAQLLDPKTHGATRAPDQRSLVAIAQTLPALRPPSAPAPASPPVVDRTLPLAQSAPRLVEPPWAVQRMGMSTAKPVSSERAPLPAPRAPRAPANRSVLYASAGIVVLSLAGVGYATSGRHGASAIAPAAATASVPPSAPLEPQVEPPASATPAAPLPALAVDDAAAQVPSTVVGGTSERTGKAPLATRPVPSATRLPTGQPAIASSVRTKAPAAVVPSAAPICHAVLDHVDDQGNKFYRKQCD